jgi:murein DD-endopeptidase MepM/ murein hydrolase activator NlpD
LRPRLPGSSLRPPPKPPSSGGFNLQGALLNQLASGGKIDFLGLAGAQQRSDQQRPSRLAQAAGEPPTPGRSPVGQGTEGKIIGTPYHGTHTVGNWESDNAIDEAIPVGTPVRSPFDGVIGGQIGSLGSSNPRMAGLRVHVEGRGNEAYLAHLSKLLVHAGQRVHRGQILGYSGSANGTPHLHEALQHGNPRTIVPLT